MFDSDAGWVGPKNMRRFSPTMDLDARRAMITNARHVGSVPPRVHREFQRACDVLDLQRHQGQVHGQAVNQGVRLRVNGRRLTVDAVLLATGFVASRPGGALVDRLVQRHDLPCAACGYPIVDKHLRWHSRVLVSGRLGESGRRRHRRTRSPTACPSAYQGMTGARTDGNRSRTSAMYCAVSASISCTSGSVGS